MEKKKIDKAVLFNLVFDYARLYKRPGARIVFKEERVTLYFGGKTAPKKAITFEEAYDLLEGYIAKKNQKGKGYRGKSMSVNAREAYERGLKPMSRFTSSDLRQSGFIYSIAFFRWLIKNWEVYPKEMHHTSASRRYTAFYDASTIAYLARDCNLKLLHDIYKGKITREEAIRKRGIRLVKAQVLDTVLGGRSGKSLQVEGVTCNNLLFLSPRLCVRADDQRVVIKDQSEEAGASKTQEELINKLLQNKTHRFRKFVKK